MKHTTKIFLLLFFAISISCKQEPVLTYEQMSSSKEKSKEAFNDAKYGMFIHWGLYSIPGGIWKGKKMEEDSFRELNKSIKRIKKTKIELEINSFKPALSIALISIKFGSKMPNFKTNLKRQ